MEAIWFLAPLVRRSPQRKDDGVNEYFESTVSLDHGVDIACERSVKFFCTNFPLVILTS